MLKIQILKKNFLILTNILRKGLHYHLSLTKRDSFWRKQQMNTKRCFLQLSESEVLFRNLSAQNLIKGYFLLYSAWYQDLSVTFDEFSLTELKLFSPIPHSKRSTPPSRSNQQNKSIVQVKLILQIQSPPLYFRLISCVFILASLGLSVLICGPFTGPFN